MECFFFLSGIGLFYSLDRPKSLIAWYKKRYIRIMFPYMFVAIPWYMWGAYFHDETISQFLINVSTLNYWLYHEGVWFVAVLIPVYAISPFLYKLVLSRYCWYAIIPLITASALCILIPCDGIVYNIIWAIHRLPCFFIGFAAAKYIKHNLTVNLWVVIFLSCSLMMVLRWLDPMVGWWWPMIFIWIPFLCFIFERYRYIGNSLQIFGVISLESYLFNICLGDIVPAFEFDGFGLLRYLVIVVAGCTLAYHAHNLCSRSYRFARQ